jgi:hypothetical protein
MSMKRATILGIAALALTPAALAAQTAARAAFVTRLGNDTVAVERVTREGRELRAEVLLRSPSTTLSVYRLRFDDAGLPVSMETTTHDPAAGPGSPPTSRSLLRFGADSLTLETSSSTDAGRVSVAGGRDVIPFIDMVHWPFELMLARARTAPADSVVVPLLTGRRTTPFVVRRTAGNGYTVTHPLRGTMAVESNERGELVRLDAGRTTRALLVTRVDDADLPALSHAFAQRPPIGELSGRGEVSATVGRAHVAVDYGRPTKRGREIFGALVPYGQVWRTGANRATHFTTDRDLVIGGAAVPAGSYTLFSIPAAEGWTLIVNRRTEINGTSYDAAHDLARIPMRTRTLVQPVEDFTIRVDPEGAGGVLRLQWDRTEAFVPIAVR